MRDISLCRMGILCKFCDDFSDLYQNKLWDTCNNLNQITHLSYASGPNNDVIKMVTKVILMHTYTLIESLTDHLHFSKLAIFEVCK